MFLKTNIIHKKKDIAVAVINPTHPMAHACARLEYDIFIESGDEGYVKSNPDRVLTEYDAYPDYEFLAAFQGSPSLPLTKRQLTGVMRLTFASGSPVMKKGLFPTIDTHGKDGIWFYPDLMKSVIKKDPQTILDIASMAVLPKFRNIETSKAIITGVMKRGWEKRPVRYALAFIDTPFYLKLKSRNLPWQDLGPSVQYMGSPSTPCLLDSFRILKGINKIAIYYCRLKGFFKGIS